MRYLLVFLGGGLGAVLRYWAQGVVAGRMGGGFPYGTVLVNIIGCFVIGLLMVGLEERFLATPALRLFLTVGILGGFTTFSSFSFETMALFRDGEAALALVNVAVSVLVCLSATWTGMKLGRLV